MPNSGYFGMRGRVIPRAHLIACARQNRALRAHQNGTYGHFSGGGGGMGFVERHFHEIITHKGETSMAGAAHATAGHE
jgi:hypothetical protein